MGDILKMTTVAVLFFCCAHSSAIFLLFGVRGGDEKHAGDSA